MTKPTDYADRIVVSYLKHDLLRARQIVKSVIDDLGNGNRDIFIRSLLPDGTHISRNPVRKVKQPLQIVQQVKEG